MAIKRYRIVGILCLLDKDDDDRWSVLRRRRGRRVEKHTHPKQTCYKMQDEYIEPRILA